MKLIEVVNICLFGRTSDDDKDKKKASELVDKVIKKNKKTFDELAKH